MQQYDDAISITLVWHTATRVAFAANSNLSPFPSRRLRWGGVQAIIIVVTVAFIQEYKSEKALEALNELVHLRRVGEGWGEEERNGTKGRQRGGSLSCPAGPSV
jgi:magnesium-transporting ATPase (P-type)